MLLAQDLRDKLELMATFQRLFFVDLPKEIGREAILKWQASASVNLELLSTMGFRRCAATGISAEAECFLAWHLRGVGFAVHECECDTRDNPAHADSRQ